MKIKDGYMLREIDNTAMVIPMGTRSVDLRGIIKLNDAGAFLWKKLQVGMNCTDLVIALLDEYDVEEAEAIKDVDSFIDSLEQAGLLE